MAPQSRSWERDFYFATRQGHENHGARKSYLGLFWGVHDHLGQNGILSSTEKTKMIRRTGLQKVIRVTHALVSVLIDPGLSTFKEEPVDDDDDDYDDCDDNCINLQLDGGLPAMDTASQVLLKKSRYHLPVVVFVKCSVYHDHCSKGNGGSFPGRKREPGDRAQCDAMWCGVACRCDLWLIQNNRHAQEKRSFARLGKKKSQWTLHLATGGHAAVQDRGFEDGPVDP